MKTKWDFVLPWHWGKFDVLRGLRSINWDWDLLVSRTTNRTRTHLSNYLICILSIGLFVLPVWAARWTPWAHCHILIRSPDKIVRACDMTAAVSRGSLVDMSARMLWIFSSSALKRPCRSGETSIRCPTILPKRSTSSNLISSSGRCFTISER